MRRALVLRRARGLVGLRRFKPLDQRVDSCTQRFYFALLAKYNVAQLCIGALQKCDFGLDLLEGAGLHDVGLRESAGRKLT
jgi:hypothetical protein